MPQVVAASIYVDDMDRAIKFYRDVLNFEVRSRPVPFLAELEHEGLALMLCQAERPVRADYPGGSGTVLGIATDSVDVRLEELKRAKVELATESPQEFPGGRYIALRDPAGNVIEMLEFNG